MYIFQKMRTNFVIQSELDQGQARQAFKIAKVTMFFLGFWSDTRGHMEDFYFRVVYVDCC